jgi:hypothetical protein
VVRVDAGLLRRIDRLTAQARRERGAKWSRNDQISRMLELATRAEVEGRD